MGFGSVTVLSDLKNTTVKKHWIEVYIRVYANVCTDHFLVSLLYFSMAYLQMLKKTMAASPLILKAKIRVWRMHTPTQCHRVTASLKCCSASLCACFFNDSLSWSEPSLPSLFYKLKTDLRSASALGFLHLWQLCFDFHQSPKPSWRPGHWSLHPLHTGERKPLPSDFTPIWTLCRVYVCS